MLHEAAETDMLAERHQKAQFSPVHAATTGLHCQKPPQWNRKAFENAAAKMQQNIIIHNRYI